MRRLPTFFLVFAAVVFGACSSAEAPSTVVAAQADSSSATDDVVALPDASESDAGETVEAAPEAEPDDETEDDQDVAEDPDDEPSMAASSPLGAFFADDGGFDAAIDEYTIRVEEEIVRCMAAQGFEFAASNVDRDVVGEQQNELTEREWTTEYGYGISTSFDTIAQGRADDPNAAIYFSMSPGEREIWIETLTGNEAVPGGSDGAVDQRPLEEQGCIGEALINTGGQDAIEGLRTFGDAYEEGQEAIFDSNDMIIALGEWTRCMSEDGYPDFSELDAPEESISDRLEVIAAPLNAALGELDPEDGRALIAGDTLELESLPGLDVEALRQLQADELIVAITDLDCYDAEVRAIYEPLRDDFERGLMSDYSSELDALKNIGS